MRGLGVVFLGGLVFGFGLGVSDLLRQEVVLSFLQFDDLGLGVMMAAAVAVSLPVYQLARRLPGPVLGGRFETIPKAIARNHVLGGVVFGVGWGLSGVCPGAALASLAVGNWPMLAGLLGMLLGAYLQGIVAESEAPPTPSARGV